MTREEIRKKYTDLMNEVVKSNDRRDSLNNSRWISEEFRNLQNVCLHSFGGFNYEIGCWTCPDCGLRK